MSYYLRYQNKITYVRNEQEEILKIVYSGSWLGATVIYKVYRKGTLILVCSYYSFLFTKKITVVENHTNENIQFKKRGKRFILICNNDIYSYRKIILLPIKKSLPVFNFFKNDKETAGIYFLKWISFGGGELIRIDFNEEEETNIYQIILYIITDQQSLMG